jgi:DNA-directed RNA polymerase specialized sigma24 family protein
MKLKPDQRRAILNEMILSELFSEKAWARRYGISARTVKRLRAEARERLAQSVPQNISVTLFNAVRERKRA